jgi:ppGpp synthetase/RelA/SpoT-type nucleotidyltranferase
MLLEEYRQQLPLYNRLMEVVKQKTAEMVKHGDLTVASMEFRVKEEESLAGKLHRKGSKYSSLSDITDIFGGRIIMFYNEDVDRIASFIESTLEIDWPNSVDKRKMHETSSFGYNSLHYICRIPKHIFFDPEWPQLNEIRFEIQMRTALQHVWSAIQHDIGYKSEIETPKEYHRMLSRLAGMMELADDEFSRIRNSIADYRRRMQNLVLNGQLEEVVLDGDTFLSYIGMHPFDKLNKKIAAITQAEIHESTYLPYLKVMRQLDIKTLGDIERMMTNYSDDAYQLALFQLGTTDIDILSSNIGIQNICIVHILKNDGGKAGIRWMFDIINGVSEHNNDMAQIILEQASKLSFMNK